MPPDLNANPDAPAGLVDGGGFVLTNPEAAPHEPASVGELLSTGREHAGLSVGDVASRLRMSVKQIEALERADYANLPSGTFLRGFVRNYAKAVGVNIDEALKVLERTHTDALAVRATSVVAPSIAAEPVAYQPRSEALATPKSRAIIAVLLVACLGAVVWYWWEFVRPHRAEGGRPKETPAVVQPEITAAAPVILPTAATPDAGAAPATTIATDPNIATGVSLPTASSPISTPPAAPPLAPSAAPSSSTAAPTIAAAPAAPASAAPVLKAPTTEKTSDRVIDKANDRASDKANDKAKATAKAAEKSAAEKVVAEKAAAAADATKAKRAGEPGVLGFTFSGESWVEVVDASGRTIVSRRYKAGEADEVTGKGPFSVVVGNAASTRMAVNGREFDLTPHTRATVARVTVK